MRCDVVAQHLLLMIVFWDSGAGSTGPDQALMTEAVHRTRKSKSKCIIYYICKFEIWISNCSPLFYDHVPLPTFETSPKRLVDRFFLEKSFVE